MSTTEDVSDDSAEETSVVRDVRPGETPPVEPQPAPPEAVASASEILLLLAGLVLIAALLPLRSSIPVQIVLLGLVVTVPGALLLRVLRMSGRALALLLVPASLITLLAIGLTTSLLGTQVGVDRPLRPAPQLVAVEVVCLILLAVVAHRTVTRTGWTFPRPAIPLMPSPLLLLPVLLALLGYIGARQLDAGHGPAFAVVAVVLCIGAFVAAVVLAPRMTDAALASVLYGAALSSMWSFSNRSEAVYGYDVITEFRKMSLTAYTGQWALPHVNDAYGAMLSITVLPVQLSALTGLSLLHLVAIVYPVLFCLAPVLVYFTCRAVLDARWAFFAAAILTAQANFGQQMPGLARQQIALILFAALLLLLVTDEGPTWARRILVGLMAGGVVMTHYSTNYFAIPLFGVATVVLVVFALLRRVRWRVVLLVAEILSVLAVGAWLWNIVLTQSAANVSDAFASLNNQGFSVLGNSAGDAVLSYLQGTVTPSLPAHAYQQLVDQTYATQRAYVVPLPQAAEPRYALLGAPAIQSGAGSIVSLIVGFVARQFTLLAALAGTVLILARRSLPDGTRALAGLALGALAALAAVRLSGTLAESYNQDRALLQALFVLAPAIGWTGQTLASRRPRFMPAALTGVVAVVLAGQLAASSSLLVLPGGGDAGINVSNTGEDHQRFYSSWGEIAAASWLGEQTRSGELVYADRYGSLRFLLATGRFIGVFPEIVPTVIDENSWVYASTTNLAGTARSQTQGQQSTYEFPEAFLDQNFDVVYANGLSRVYHRSGS